MKVNVLVFPCGSQPAIEINSSLRETMRIEVFGASSVHDHGRFVYKNYIGDVPRISEPHFIEAFNAVLIEHGIKYIIPTHDTVALFLVENQQALCATVVSSDLETTRICRHKKLTYETLRDYDFTPILYGKEQELEFPVFLKPDTGQGGQGTQLVHHVRDLHYYLSHNPELLLCEYLPGEEITVDCFTDRHGDLRLISPRTRGRVLGGISVYSKNIDVSSEIETIANAIHSSLRFRGYWFFQLKKDRNGRYKLLEISTRLAGTAALSLGRDINLPLLSVLDFMGLDIEIIPNDYGIELDRSFVNRYHLDIEYDRIYVDLDDTLIFRNDYCNAHLMMFLYQCLNKGKEIYLITRHSGNVNDTLLRFKISPFIFSGIYQLRTYESKADYINTDKKAIFIDNSFAERKEVKQKLHIPAFDISNIECLIDWRG